jgi:flagellin-specific chaperone FliS
MEARIRRFQYITNHEQFDKYSTVLRELNAFLWYRSRRPWKNAIKATHEWVYRNLYDYDWFNDCSIGS